MKRDQRQLVKILMETAAERKWTLRRYSDDWIIVGDSKANRIPEDMDEEHSLLWASIQKLKEKITA